MSSTRREARSLVRAPVRVFRSGCAYLEIAVSPAEVGNNVMFLYTVLLELGKVRLGVLDRLTLTVPSGLRVGIVASFKEIILTQKMYKVA